MGVSRLKSFTVVLLSAVLMVLLAACAGQAPTPTPTQAPQSATATPPATQLEGTLTIFHAGSLSVPFRHINEAFNKLHPNVKIEMESAGSRSTIRKVTELGKQADIVGSADYVAIEQLMFPQFADWHVRFARNRMVIVYTDQSKFKDEINQDNWYQILLRPGVNYGHSDPNADPCGYRSLLVWQLAEKHYNSPGLYQKLNASCPARNIRPKETDLLALLQSGDLDYAFEYLSIAKQHNLNYVELPTEIDLSALEHDDFYKNARVEVTGTEPGTMDTQVGQAIIYGLTIPKNAPNHAVALEWARFALGPQGQAILQQDGQPPIAPALASDINKVPAELKGLVK